MDDRIKNPPDAPASAAELVAAGWRPGGGGSMKILTSLVAVGVFWLAESWTLMLLAGAVHGEWLPKLPTLAFSGALVIDVALTAFLVAWRTGNEIAEVVCKA